LAESDPNAKAMRLPKLIRHRKGEATVYGKSKRCPFYRIVYRADSQTEFKQSQRAAPKKLDYSEETPDSRLAAKARKLTVNNAENISTRPRG
jgi:hypothetical protein